MAELEIWICNLLSLHCGIFSVLIKFAAGVASIKLVVCLCVFVAHYHNEIIMLYNRNRAQEWEFFIITGLQAVENDKMKVAKQWSF